jgi:hypothetical protein
LGAASLILIAIADLKRLPSALTSLKAGLSKPWRIRAKASRDKRCLRFRMAFSISENEWKINYFAFSGETHLNNF